MNLLGSKWCIVFGLVVTQLACSADYSITLSAGFHLIANQLDHLDRFGIDNTVVTILNQAPENTTIYKYDQSLNGGTGGFRPVRR